MSYTPGTHIIASLTARAEGTTEKYESCKKLIDEIILQHHLQKLGEVYHNFIPGGFTAIVCLSESHLSIHTWPEHRKINLDIYLSNYLRTNDNTVKSIYLSLIEHFDGEINDEHIILR